MTENAMNDNHLGELMRSAQAGSTEEYVQLLREITPPIRRMVRRYRYFLAHDAIEDLVQDVLLSVHSVRATYDPNRPFLPWLLAIARNRLADGARRYARSTAHEVTVESLDVTFAGKDTNRTEEVYGDPQALEEAIAALPPMQRNAIRMLKLGGMSLKEAADASNTTVGALKVASHRAMATLRKMLVTEK